VGFDPSRQTGAVVLANSSSPVVDELGLALLRLLAGEPHSLALPQFQNVAVSGELLERYVGTYELAPGATVAISRDGLGLWARFPAGQGRLLASSPTEFRMRANPSVRISFDTRAGDAPALIFEDRGERIVAPRVTR
jgi:hypothetical protein